jgi:hypothetical protein
MWTVMHKQGKRGGDRIRNMIKITILTLEGRRIGGRR